VSGCIVALAVTALIEHLKDLQTKLFSPRLSIPQDDNFQVAAGDARKFCHVVLKADDFLKGSPDKGLPNNPSIVLSNTIAQSAEQGDSAVTVKIAASANFDIFKTGQLDKYIADFLDKRELDMNYTYELVLVDLMGKVHRKKLPAHDKLKLNK